MGSARPQRGSAWTVTLPLLSADEFAAAMDDAGLSCAALADMVECSKANIGHLRTGKHKACSLPLAMAIEHCLRHVTTGPLFYRDVEALVRASTGRTVDGKRADVGARTA